MEISEINENKIHMVDINDLEPVKAPKKRGRKPKKSTEEEISVEPVTSIEKLREELLMLSDYNPEIVTKPVNNNLAKLVNEMSIEELRARIRQGKRATSAKMDDTVVESVLSLSNQMTGLLLGCLDELQTSTHKDELLKGAIKDYLSINVLDYIPTEIKLIGLYGSHVTSSYYKASLKQTPKVTEIKEKPELTQEQKNKLDLIKNKLSLLTNKDE